MDYKNPDALVSADWLKDHLNEVKVLDATWYLPSEDKDADAEYEKEHIPGAVRFSIDEVCDKSIDLPHMFPTAEDFSKTVGAMGISNDDHVVVYDQGVMAAPRAWWTFKVFGHEKVSVLDGGLPAWKKAGGPVTDERSSVDPADYTANMNLDRVRDFVQMRKNVEEQDEVMVDARAAGFYTGEAPYPRPTKNPGHIPGSMNLHYDRLYNDDRTVKSADELNAEFKEKGLDPSKPITATCGSGVSACNVLLGLYLMGYDKLAVYDASFAEWGNRDDAPVEKGE